MLPRRAGYALAVINVIWRGAIIIASLFALGYCSLALYRQFDPTFLLPPLDAHVLKHCARSRVATLCDLIPAFFTVGESADEVLQQMSAAGYQHGLFQGSEGTWTVNGEKHQFTDYFIGPKGSMSLACSYELSIYVRFGSTGELEAAIGDNSTACL